MRSFLSIHNFFQSITLLSGTLVVGLRNINKAPAVVGHVMSHNTEMALQMESYPLFPKKVLNPIFLNESFI